MSYIYDTKTVMKPRTSSSCTGCGKELPKKEPRTVVTYYDSEFNNTTICLGSKECLEKFAEESGYENNLDFI